jgi:2-polyprenyl-3-methyl-5-hydroxy-6-metoxy-1,4-benzoquinol methylase
MQDITRLKFHDCPNVVVADVSSLQKEDFDLLVCSSVVEYVDQPESFLESLTTYVRPGGVLLITFANQFAPLQLINRHILRRLKPRSYANVQKHSFSRSAIRRLCEDCRLEILSLTTPIGIPVVSRIGLGELYFLVAKKPS